jgi:hypothetical protein
MKDKLFAILIPTLTERAQLLNRLISELDKQRAGKNVIIIIAEDQKQKTTGAKRNDLIQAAIENNVDYFSFHDEDDLPGPNYIKRNMEGITLGYDTNSLWGQLYVNNKPDNPFHHSLKYDHWFQDKTTYYRCNNHLNCMKLSLVKDIPFEDITVGEDGRWSMAIQKAGVLKTEYQINETIYHYFTGKKNHSIEPNIMVNRTW